MTEEAQRDGHPIRDVVALLIKDGGPGEEPAVLDEVGLAQIREELDSLIGQEELVDAVDTLLLLADVIALQQKSEKCAVKLCEVVERDEVVDALRALNRKKDAERAEAVAKTAEKFTGFVGQNSTKKAPKNSDAAPKGSVKLGSLDFPKKL
jgi:hypothetical protein